MSHLTRKDEIAALKALTENERRFLGRRECVLCEQRLNRPGCATVYGTGAGCTAANRIDRMKRCLETYIPRKAKSESDN